MGKIGTWQNAKTACDNIDGHLVEIETEAEQDLLEAEVMKIKKQNRNFPFRMWIGLTDLNEEGVWRWDSGAKATYLPWTQRKRNSFPGSQDCVVMDFTWFGNNGKWNKFWCSARGFYSNWSVGAICELN